MPRKTSELVLASFCLHNSSFLCLQFPSGFRACRLFMRKSAKLSNWIFMGKNAQHCVFQGLFGYANGTLCRWFLFTGWNFLLFFIRAPSSEPILGTWKFSCVTVRVFRKSNRCHQIDRRYIMRDRRPTRMVSND